MNRATLEISYSSLQHNLDLIKKLAINKSIICIVKDNSYGLGSINISKYLSKDSSVKAFAVSCIDEAMQLKENGIVKDIIIIGHVLKDQILKTIENNIIITISTYEQAMEINHIAKQHNIVARVEVAVDSGMSRIGFAINNDSLSDIIDLTKLENISIYGFFTHFSVADCDSSDFKNIKLTDKEEKRFNDFIDKIDVNGIKYNDISMSNSAGIITSRGMKFTSVRPGITLYGLLPNKEFSKFGFKPIMQLKSKIVYIKEIEKGTSVSYGRTFIAKDKMKIATISCGYGDGYPRTASNKCFVIINDKKCPIVGRVTMDMFMVDVTGVDCKIEDDVILVGESNNQKITYQDIADITGEFTYELLTRINKRVARTYID